MPATRSSSRSTRLGTNADKGSASSRAGVQLNPQKASTRKRKTESAHDKLDTKKKARKTQAIATPVQVQTHSVVEGSDIVTSSEGDIDTIVPAVLTFSLEEAKQHLISVDNRFEDLFKKLACKPFENLESFHPFQVLSTSILGQQISWLAARSIIHKFKRLFDPSLPEKPGEFPAKSFPTPAQVASTELSILRTAGLSQRKAEYIQDLAKRFADGRLSTMKILSANDEDLAKMLIEVRGIGRWTVDMFAIFSLRRPDILPVGDLGVQRGLARWALALHSHSPSDRFGISPQKLSDQASTARKSEGTSVPLNDGASDDEEGYLPLIGETQNSGPTNSVVERDVDMLVGGLPPLFTPSISKTLKKSTGSTVGPLPKTLSVAELKNRIGGKKKIKGALLTPQEMEEITDAWKPYRSLGVYYMWSLASANTTD